MGKEEDVIHVAWSAGEMIWVHGRGNPAVMVAGLVVAGGALIGYGGYRYGSKIYDYLIDSNDNNGS